MATALEGVRRQLDHHKSNANRILQEIVKCSVEVKSLDTPKFQDVRAVELAPSSDLNRVRSLLDRLEFVRRAQSHLKHVKLLNDLSRQLENLNWPTDPISASTKSAKTIRLMESMRNLVEAEADPRQIINTICQPLIARFRFHFFNEKSKANNVYRPEWFLQHVRALVLTHGYLLTRLVQSCFSISETRQSYFAVDLFLDCFVDKAMGGKFDLVFRYFQATGLLTRRMSSISTADDNELSKDQVTCTKEDEYSEESLLAINHLIREGLEFDSHCMRELGYNRNFFANKLFTDSVYSEMFIMSEKLILSRKYEALMSSIDPFRHIYFGIPKCAFDLIESLQTVIKTCCKLRNLSSPANLDFSIRVRLIDYLVELMDQFGVYLIETKSSPVVDRLFACDYVIKVMAHWQNDPIFYFNYGGEDYDDIFRDMLNHYRMQHFQSLVRFQVRDFKLAFNKFTFPPTALPPSQLTKSISPQMAAAINGIYEYTAAVKKQFQDPGSGDVHALFATVFKQICQCINDEWSKRISKKMYKHTEAQQLMHDIFNGLLVVMKKLNGDVAALDRLTDYVDILCNGPSSSNTVDADTARTLINLRLDF